MRRFRLTAALTLIISMFFALHVYADTGPAVSMNMPVTAEIKAEHIIKGIKGSKDKYVFVLEAEDPSNPMPEGSEDGCKTVTTSESKDIRFGPISFDYPGAYYYTVSQKNNDTTYRVMIGAFNDGTSEMVIWNMDDGGKADRIRFTDQYRTTPKTGDTEMWMTLMLSICGGLTATAALILMIWIRRKECRTDEKQ